MFVIATPLVVALACSHAIHQRWLSEHAAAFSGTLEPEDRFITLPNGTRPERVIDGGDSDIGFIDESKTGTILRFDNDEVTLRKQDGKVLFSTSVKDQFGHTAVEIADNHWRVNPDKLVS